VYIVHSPPCFVTTIVTMSLSSLGQLAVLNRQRRAAEAATARPILKPVQIQVANEPIQLIHDLMRLSLSSATNNKTKKKSQNRKPGEDLNASFKEIEHEQSSALTRRHVAIVTGSRTCSTEEKAAADVQNKKKEAGNESSKKDIAERMILRTASQCTSRHRRQNSLTVHNKGLAGRVRQEDGKDDQESEDELRLEQEDGKDDQESEDELRLKQKDGQDDQESEDELRLEQEDGQDVQESEDELRLELSLSEDELLS
jgi:hypothetical protein